MSGKNNNKKQKQTPVQPQEWPDIGTSGAPAGSGNTEHRYHQRWVTDGAWISGVAGMLTIVFLAYHYHTARVFERGFTLSGQLLLRDRFDTILLALAIITSVMFVTEVTRLWFYDRKQFIQIDPVLKAGRYGKFFLLAIKHYLLLALLFSAAKIFYQTVGEYGFRANHRYYASWFHVLDALWYLYLWAGLPYILATRAWKHNPEADKKDLAGLTEKSLSYLLACIPLFRHLRQPFESADKKAALGLAVKVFFAPVMTVFFFDNFVTLTNNFDYIFGGLSEAVSKGTYTHGLFNKDLSNIGPSFIFTIDVGLAWCGYILSSRWVDNQTISAEPTWFGWIVCLLSYPPFRVIPGWILTGPGEKLYLQLPDQNVVSLFGLMMVISYLIYMLPTIWFGVRFSNLTHRGIIRKGPFAIVRHPAYAAKNFGWWCVGFPVAIYSGMNTGVEQALIYTGGLIFLTSIYYFRAITEENHLSMDPDYVEYCKHVKYRFIPGVV